ncbi:MAG: hypothetical protein ACE5FN_08420 [Leptospirillia bacterium]
MARFPHALFPTLALVLLFTLPVAPAFADDTDQKAASVTARIGTDAGLLADEIFLLNNPVRDHLAHGGREQLLRELVHQAVGHGCRADCLAEAVRSLTRLHAAGLPLIDAHRITVGQIDLAARNGTGETLPQRLRSRIDTQLGQWTSGSGSAANEP